MLILLFELLEFWGVLIVKWFSNKDCIWVSLLKFKLDISLSTALRSTPGIFKFRLDTLFRIEEGEREGDNMLRKEGRDDNAGG